MKLSYSLSEHCLPHQEWLLRPAGIRNRCTTAALREVDLKQDSVAVKFLCNTGEDTTHVKLFCRKEFPEKSSPTFHSLRIHIPSRAITIYEVGFIRDKNSVQTRRTHEDQARYEIQ